MPYKMAPDVYNCEHELYYPG